MTINKVYVKINNKILYILNGKRNEAFDKLLQKRGLSYQALEQAIKTHRSQVERLNTALTRASNVIPIRPNMFRECEYELDLNKGIIKAYASGIRTYKVFKLKEAYDIDEKKVA